jgi:hypothetical protein
MYLTQSGMLWRQKDGEIATDPVLVIPLDPENVEHVVEVMSAAMGGSDVDQYWYDQAKAALNALVALGKGTT